MRENRARNSYVYRGLCNYRGTRSSNNYQYYFLLLSDRPLHFSTRCKKLSCVQVSRFYCICTSCMYVYIFCSSLFFVSFFFLVSIRNLAIQRESEKYRSPSSSGCRWLLAPLSNNDLISIKSMNYFNVSADGTSH